jgi:hypothetical protein
MARPMTIIDQLYALAHKLKNTERCVSSIYEGRPCVTKEVRWVGRELARIAGQISTLNRDVEYRIYEVRKAERDPGLLGHRLTAAKVRLADEILRAHAQVTPHHTAASRSDVR